MVFRFKPNSAQRISGGSLEDESAKAEDMSGARGVYKA